MSRAVLALTLTACGRIGFGTLADGGGSNVDAAIDSNIGAACAMDADCGRCARCENLVCQSEPIVQLALGHRIMCYIGAGGSRWCTGENDAGELGLGLPDTQTDQLVPMRIPGEDGWTALYLGYLGSLGIRNGDLWAWGNGVDLPADMGTAAGIVSISSDTLDTNNNLTCTLMSDATASCDPTGSHWSGVDSGGATFCGVKLDGTLWCWGVDNHGDTGQGPAGIGVTSTMPIQVGTDSTWAIAVAGNSVSCGRKTDGTLWCWGEAVLTGTNDVDTMGVPTQVGTDTDWTSLELEYTRACAGKTDGSIWCWGDFTSFGGYIVPGQPTEVVPTMIPGSYDPWVIGGHDSCGLANGRWSCFGWNAAGQLGIGSTAQPTGFVDVCP